MQILRTLLTLAALLVASVALPGAARATCPAGVNPASWVCQPPIAPAQGTDEVLGWRPSLGVAGQGPISVSDLLAALNFTVSDGSTTLDSVFNLLFSGGGCTVTGPAPTATITCAAALTVTDGITTITGVDALDFGGGGCIVGGTSPTATVTCTGGGGGVLTIQDSSGNVVNNASVLQLGPGFLVTGVSTDAVANLNQPNRTVSVCAGTPSSCLITANDLGGQVNFNGSNLTLLIPSISSASFTGSLASGVLTVSGVTGTIAVGQTLQGGTVATTPGTIIVSGSGTTWQTNHTQTIGSQSMNSSMLPSGTTFTVTNYNATPLAISCGGGLAINIYPSGCSALIPSAGAMACVSNGATLDCPGLAVQPNQAFTTLDQTWTGKQTWGSANRPPNVQSGATYTISSADCGGTVQTTNGSAVTITLPGSLTGFAGNGVGCTVIIDQEGAGQVTVVSDGSSTLTTAINGGTAVHTRTQHSLVYETATVSTLGALNWNLGGDAT